jgi:hypothetical protein
MRRPLLAALIALAARALGAAQQLPVFAGRLATYGADALALVGQRPSQTAAEVERADPGRQREGGGLGCATRPRGHRRSAVLRDRGQAARDDRAGDRDATAPGAAVDPVTGTAVAG